MDRLPTLDQLLHESQPFIYMVILITILAATIWHSGTWVLSKAVQEYLAHCFPITSTNGHSQVPTVPWVWPNGQGDIGKFFEGKGNSSVWKRDYGVVYRIWSGTRGEIVISNPEDIRAVYTDSDQHTKATSNNSGWLFSKLLGDCMGELSGAQWKSVHDSVASHFSRSASHKYALMIRQRATQWTAEFCRPIPKGQAAIMRPAADLRQLTFRVIAEVLYGNLSTEHVIDLETMLPTRERLLHVAMTKTLPKHALSQHLPTKTNSDLKYFQAAWQRWNADVVGDITSSNEVATPAQALLQAASHGTIEFSQALQTLDEMLFANIDVTLAAAAWCIVLLAEHVDWQAQLTAEIEHTKHAGDWQAYLTSNSTCLASVVLEAGRLRPLAAFSVPQSAPTERVLQGYRIPAGTDFIVDAYTTNFAPETWGPDGRQFRPSRWQHLAPKDQHARRYQSWRFGFGPRQCMGRFVADLLLRNIVVALLESFTMTLDPTLHDPSARDPSCWIAMPMASVRCVQRDE